jgi:NAD(P)-dependent dehydrogenase (short-subunit alcohol dehydrogenase family)
MSSRDKLSLERVATLRIEGATRPRGDKGPKLIHRAQHVMIQRDHGRSIMDRLNDKVAIVTGGTSGIGRACAIRFAAEGAHVVIAGRRREAGNALAASLGERSIFVAADVTRGGDIKALVERALERFGRIDCVISNAGNVSATGPIADTDPVAFDDDFAVHVRAPFLAMKYASPSMVARRTGSFIHMSSISAHRAGFNTFGYEVAKAALVHLTRCAAIEFGEKGVRVNSISPGPTRTAIFAKAAGASQAVADERIQDVEAAFANLLPSIQPMPGMIHAEDVADAALFLASDEARFVNGHDLIVDGGITAGRPAATMKAGWQALADALQTAGVHDVKS